MAESESSLPSWDYLETFPGTQFFRLYRSPASALAIFRKRLTNLAKSFVMVLLYMPRPMPTRDLELFVKPESAREQRSAIELLLRYHIFRLVTFKSTKSYALTPEFAKSLRKALIGAEDSSSFGQLATITPSQRISIAKLDHFARRQWEGILGFMVNSKTSANESEDPLPEPNPGIIELLRVGELITLTGSSYRGQAVNITKNGFQFVLQDVNTQIWALLFLYAENAEAFDMDKVDVLSFIFLVASLELGQAYSMGAFNPNQKKLLRDLIGFGVVYSELDSSDGEFTTNYFFPTRLASTLTSDSSDAIATTNSALGSSLAPGAGTGGQGFIIVETNYRIYAYTSSPLQTALLSLFVHLKSKHPNLVAGKMTKSSVQRAVRVGITAQQIVEYLQAHAHPQMRRRQQAEQAALQARSTGEDRVIPMIPGTIVDQIHLWQRERDRMLTTHGYLLKNFTGQAEYDRMCTHVDEIGILVWKNDKKQMFFVNRIEPVKAYMQDRRES